MKKSVKLLALVMAVVLVSACFAATTLAKYTSTLTTTSAQTAVAAKWIGNNASIELGNLFARSYGETGNEKAAASSATTGNIIAPGIIHSAAVTVNLDGVPEVAYTWGDDCYLSVTQDDGLGMIWGVSFDGTQPQLAEPTNGKITLTMPDGDYAPNDDASTDLNMTIWWEWEEDDSTDIDFASAGSVEVTLNLEIEQVTD